MSRQGAPVRNRHAIPSNVLRMSIGGRPRPLGAGNNGASTAHCSSVISCRVAMTSTLTARHPESVYQHALVAVAFQPGRVQRRTRCSPTLRSG